MLKLKNYSFKNIGRFVQQQTIDFEHRDHLIQIDGENTNTGGSSGAGKSTTVEALAYLLGISDTTATQLQSRITKSPIWVEGEFEGDITITRSKKDGLTIKTPEGTVSGNSKLAEEKLDEIIGVDRKLLKTMAYKRQKQGGFFLNLTPKESHNFLVQCLDLGEFQQKIFKLEDKIKNNYKPNKIRLESAIEVLVGNIDQLGTLLEQKVKPIEPDLINIDEKKFQEKAIRQKLQSIEENFTNIKNKLGTKPTAPESVSFSNEKEGELIQIGNTIDITKELIKNNSLERQTAIDQATSALTKIKDSIVKSKRSQSDVANLVGQLEELKHKKEHLDGGNCPTCKRAWEADRSSVEDLNGKIDSITNEINLHKEQALKLPHLTAMLEKGEQILELKRNVVVNEKEEKDLSELQEKQRVLLNEKQNIQDAANQVYLKELNEYNSKLSLIEKQYNEESGRFQSELNKTVSEIDSFVIKKGAYEEALRTFETDIANIKEKRDSAREDLKQKMAELDVIERGTLLSEESIRLIKNFTLQKFQNTLDYIGDRSTQIINQIPNMANAVIFFENAKETKSGNIKNEVNAVINLEGDSKVPIKTLSGGERTSADFAIDLAVGEMIESMTKKGVNFLIVDEGFDGLDSISKIACLEILKTLNTDKKILMVDHSSEVKEMVYDIIKVKRINEESFVQ